MALGDVIVAGSGTGGYAKPFGLGIGILGPFFGRPSKLPGTASVAAGSRPCGPRPTIGGGADGIPNDFMPATAGVAAQHAMTAMERKNLFMATSTLRER